MPFEAIAAEYEQVSLLNCDDLHVQEQLFGSADGACHQISVRMVDGLLRRQHAAFDQLFDQCMVLADLLQPPVAIPIHAAVTGPQAHGMLAANQKRDHGAADGVALFAIGVIAQALICLHQAPLHCIDEVAERARRLELLYRRDHHLARDVPGEVSAHAVGDQPQADVGPLQIGVLVELAHCAHVAASARCPAKR